MKYTAWVLALFLGWVALQAARPNLRGSAAAAPPTDPARVEAKGLHNVFRLSDKLYSGSSPDGEEGFRSLQDLGVKAVLSVDGARPDVALARQYGLRYVHLPVGYDGISQEQALRLAKAVRDLPGPVYLHCHHGKHRGPTAAAVAHLCLDEKCTVEAALATMRRAGTDPHYTGLYAALRSVRRPTARELDRLPAEFPETARVPALAQAMVGLDERWENLKRVRAAGWKTPKDHPDIDPAHEALLLREGYREAARLDDARRRPAEFRRLLAEAEPGAKELEEVLRNGTKAAVDAPAAEEAFRRAGAACTHCHARFRDAPRKP
jgi:protein tyrosine phosphatase (PTP) superfamily phosphohydrolase (DUF442 family)